MICDAHVHMGYFSRKGMAVPFYYSPRRIFGILNRCGVDEFIVSSTCAQIRGINIEEIIREAYEMKHHAGSRAHLFFWLSGHLYDEDPDMTWLDCGLFEGVKFHECETPWIGKRRRDLEKILNRLEMQGLHVIFHCAGVGMCSPQELLAIARKHPRVHFNFAHCAPMDDMAAVLASQDNIWTDTAYMDESIFKELCKYDWRGRLMFGTDIPVWQSKCECSLTGTYRKYINKWSEIYPQTEACSAFKQFLGTA